MQHVSTYNSHLQAELRTVIALQGGCAHLGSNMAYSVKCAHVCTRHTLNTVSHIGSQMCTTTL